MPRSQYDDAVDEWQKTAIAFANDRRFLGVEMMVRVRPERGRRHGSCNYK